jgi:uncharacterized repeat protein (TIGR01451 family)
VTLRGLLVAACWLGVAPAAARAQTYEVSSWTVDGGGAIGVGAGAFVLSGTAGQPDAGTVAIAAPFAHTGGFWSTEFSSSSVAQVDLSVTKTDGLTTVAAGQPLTYTIVVSNAGPAAASGASLVDTAPPQLTAVSWTCTPSAGAGCPASGAGSIHAPLSLPVGATATFSMTGTVAQAALGSISNRAVVAAPAGTIDPLAANNVAIDVDAIVSAFEGELAHGSVLRGDLRAVAGAADVDSYRMRQEPFASYEAVLDEGSGDIGAGQGPLLERVAADGTTVLQAAASAGAGPARSLRFRNTTTAAIADQGIRVRSASCSTDCGGDDRYRLRVYETTAAVPRFNNAGSQVTVVLVQNRGAETVGGTLQFFGPAGVLLHAEPFTLAPRALLVFNTAAEPALAGQGGSLTVAHDGRYGDLAGKAVALEPATGFGFDSPLEPRRR